MAIRFSCPSCKQPIEIDDEWSGRIVACPYCRNTVNAPTESTLTPDAAVPIAKPLGREHADTGSHTAGWPEPAGEATWTEQRPPSPALRQPERPGSVSSPLATIALVCMVLSMGATIGAKILAAAHMDEILGTVSPESLTMQEAMQRSQQYFSTFPPPGWAIGMMLLMMASGVCWLAAMILACIALYRGGGRNHAIAALVGCGLVPLVMCCLGPA